jgi:hypothetical protein
MTTRECSNHIGVVLSSIAAIILWSAIWCTAQPDIPTGLTARGYDSHVELRWNANAEPNLSSYRLYRKNASGDYELVANINRNNRQYIDFTGRKNESYLYALSATNNSGQESLKSPDVHAATREFSDEELLDMVQEYTFRYFWDFAHPISGLARERNTTSIVTTGGSGFGIMAILAGIERGYISRQQGLERMIRIVDFLKNKADRFHGAFPHWLNGATGKTIPFSTKDNGADLVETAFLLQGLLTARSYFDQTNTDEIVLRADITSIWESVEWSWFRRGGQNVLYWHWSPDYGWDMNLQIRGFNECHIVYLLAVMSPTYPIPPQLYHHGWAGSNYVNNSSYYGYPMYVGPFRGGPLFFSHYSYLGFDPRNIKDAYANYFVRNTHHALINWSYCKENPKNFKGYSEECWGLTASDNPFGYSAHEPTGSGDNGTIAPTAALASFPYTPVQSMAALKHFYRVLGQRLWGIYGFYDAFNQQHNWFAGSYLAIDQGPIICMIENYRSGLLWNYFMKNPEVQPMLDKVGFVRDLSGSSEYTSDHVLNNVNIYPNPVSGQFIMISGLKPLHIYNVEVWDTNGQICEAVKRDSDEAGNLQIPLDSRMKGLAILKLSSGKDVIIRKLIIN